METTVERMKINGVDYVREDSVQQEKLTADYVIVRTYTAGVFAGYLVKREGKEVELKRARRLWYWDGASSLSQLAVDGVCRPQNCKFPCEVEKIILTEAIEILPCTEKAKNSIEGVPIWNQK